MRPKDFCVRFSIFGPFIFAILTLITAAPQAEEGFGWGDTDIGTYPDDVFVEPSSLFSDIGSDPSFSASGSWDISNGAEGSPTWSLQDSVPIAADISTSGSSCSVGDDNLFEDDSLVDDVTLQARDDGSTMCVPPKGEQLVIPSLDLFRDARPKIPQIPKKYVPPELNKPPKTKFIPPPDPRGSVVKEYGQCFLPYVTRCCCEGIYAWGSGGIWGAVIESIRECSISMLHATPQYSLPHSIADASRSCRNTQKRSIG